VCWELCSGLFLLLSIFRREDGCSPTTPVLVLFGVGPRVSPPVGSSRFARGFLVPPERLARAAIALNSSVFMVAVIAGPGSVAFSMSKAPEFTYGPVPGETFSSAPR